MAFIFEYVGYWLDRGDGRPGSEIHCLFGRIVSGECHMNDEVIVKSIDGQDFVGRVESFWDTLYDWLGMPFYHTVVAHVGPFSMRVRGLKTGTVLVCPGSAHF